MQTILTQNYYKLLFKDEQLAIFLLKATTAFDFEFKITTKAIEFVNLFNRKNDYRKTYQLLNKLSDLNIITFHSEGKKLNIEWNNNNNFVRLVNGYND